MIRQFAYFLKDVSGLIKDNKRTIRLYLRLLTEQRLHALLIYRFGRSLYYEMKPGMIFIPLRILYLILNKFFLELLLGIYLPADCDIGPGLVIGSFQGLVINPHVRIGKNCSLGHGVIIGTAGDGTSRVPYIGDNVYVGSRAVIIGGIKIGDNVKIGANSVVNRDVPSNVTVAGVPAVIIERQI